MGRIRQALHGWSLLVRLVVILTALIAFGLVVAGLLSATLLQRFLVTQVDTKLRAEGKAAATQTLSDYLNGSQSSYLPTDYCLRIQLGSTDVSTTPTRVAQAEYGTPALPEVSMTRAEAIQGQPFTVTSDTTVAWRAVAYPIYNRDTGELAGSVVIALPLGDIQETTRQLAAVLLKSGLGIILVGGLTGAWAVNRSLRPLREIERTAAAIADGDLSRRIPTAPERTEVGRLGLALNGMLSQIEQAFSARTASEARMRRFVADASHELRTPLAAIRGYAELYRMGALATPHAMDDTMKRIEGSATRMGTLVEDLLALARLDEGRPLDLAPVDLLVLAADALGDLQALDPHRPTRLLPLDGDGSAAACWVRADEARVRQVVANLVGNVVRHTPSGTAAELAIGAATGPAGEPVGVIEVRDHGPGIAPEHADRVFERFYRVDASRTRDSGGAGLGMAIVASIVAAHHGTVELLTTAGGGTTVRVALPQDPGPGNERDEDGLR
ncbi:MAG: HAMP domain-containing histidine kinase [Actinobacteria bacterium]|nr:HAMP domain-containing histidine kinase [Actinomycetota bacterium]MCG2801469.1 HAMP domain-containing histidine kinase [Cellulomonas sp.]